LGNSELFQFSLELRLKDYLSFIGSFSYFINLIVVLFLILFLLTNLFGISNILYWKKLFIFFNIMFATFLSPPDVYSQISILVFLVVMLAVLLWFGNKNQNENYDLSEDINKEIESLDKQLKDLQKQISSNNNLLETYNKVITNKSEELESYKEASTNTKQKGLFTSLIGIIDFIEKFNLDNSNLDEKTKNYLIAIQDKLEIALSSTGIEKFEPNLNDNIMEVMGCTPSRKTQKTNNKNKVNLISRVLKPGYRILIKDDKFNYIKNAEVEIFELEQK